MLHIEMHPSYRQSDNGVGVNVSQYDDSEDHPARQASIIGNGDTVTIIGSVYDECDDSRDVTLGTIERVILPDGSYGVIVTLGGERRTYNALTFEVK